MEAPINVASIHTEQNKKEDDIDDEFEDFTDAPTDSKDKDEKYVHDSEPKKDDEWDNYDTGINNNQDSENNSEKKELEQENLAKLQIEAAKTREKS